MIIFWSGIFGGFFFGRAVPAATFLFNFFLLYRLVKYIEKPMIHAIPITPPHTLPAIIGVNDFGLRRASRQFACVKSGKKAETSLVEAASEEVTASTRYVELGFHAACTL